MIFVFSIIITLSSISAPARADCADPAGKEGHQVYNRTYKIMQFCDGTRWWGMKGGGGLLLSGTEGALQFFSGGSLAYSSGLIFTSAGRLGIGTETPDEILTVSGGIKFMSGVLTFPDSTTMSTAPGAESDPKIGTMIPGKWCTTDGTTVDCAEDAPGGGGPYTGNLVNAVHTGQNCLESGGYPVEAGSGIYVCKFGYTSFITFNHAGGSDTSCPNGWTQFQSWTTTVPRTCTNANSCTTGSHVWADQAQETCEYVHFGWQSGDPLSVCTAAKYYLACY